MSRGGSSFPGSGKRKEISRIENLKTGLLKKDNKEDDKGEVGTKEL